MTVVRVSSQCPYDVIPVSSTGMTPYLAVIPRFIRGISRSRSQAAG
ncbi:hypothetical protein [Wolbachia pipientis]|nr:hypothetical protein [Wolbachia pipientis]